VLATLLAAGLVDQDAAHGFGRGGEESSAAFPLLALAAVDQLQVRLVDQGRGLHLTRLLARQLSGGQPA
jgi:hypothetical protein